MQRKPYILLLLSIFMLLNLELAIADDEGIMIDYDPYWYNEQGIEPDDVFAYWLGDNKWTNIQDYLLSHREAHPLVNLSYVTDATANPKSFRYLDEQMNISYDISIDTMLWDRCGGVLVITVHSQQVLLKPIECLSEYCPGFVPLNEYLHMNTFISIDIAIDMVPVPSLMGNWYVEDNGHTLRWIQQYRIFSGGEYLQQGERDMTMHLSFDTLVNGSLMRTQYAIQDTTQVARSLVSVKFDEIRLESYNVILDPLVYTFTQLCAIQEGGGCSKIDRSIDIGFRRYQYVYINADNNTLTLDAQGEWFLPTDGCFYLYLYDADNRRCDSIPIFPNIHYFFD